MKRIKIIHIAVLMIACIFIAGCSNINDREVKYLYNAYEKLKSLENGEIIIDNSVIINGSSPNYSSGRSYMAYEYTRKGDIVNYTLTVKWLESEGSPDIIGYEGRGIGTTDYKKKLTTDIYYYDDDGNLREEHYYDKYEDGAFIDVYRTFSELFNLADKHGIKNIRDMASIEVTQNDSKNSVYTVELTQEFIDKENERERTRDLNYDLDDRARFFIKKAVYTFEINAKDKVLIRCDEDVLYEVHEEYEDEGEPFEYTWIKKTYIDY